MQEILVTANEAGQRFDKLLAKYLNEAPKSFLYKMLRKKNIVLNGKKAAGNEKLEIGDRIQLFLSDDTIEKFSKIQIKRTTQNLNFIYEDDNILMVNKPVGMLSQKAEDTDESLVEHIITYLLQSGQITEESLRKFRPSVCNRLDRNTSGIVVAGKSLAGLQEMGELFRTRSLKKFYRCLVFGEVRETQHIKGYLKKDEKTNKVTVFSSPKKNSLPIETEYTPLWSNADCTFLEVHLITGRTHQIRAHLASVDHPIIGDYKYGNRKINDRYQEKYGLKSQLLHAFRLELPELSGTLHAVSQKQFIAPLPELFERILEGETHKNGNMEFERTSGVYFGGIH